MNINLNKDYDKLSKLLHDASSLFATYAQLKEYDEIKSDVYRVRDRYWNSKVEVELNNAEYYERLLESHLEGVDAFLSHFSINDSSLLVIYSRHDIKKIKEYIESSS